MAQRPKSRLPKGTGVENFSSPTKIMKTLGTEKAIREEYSRQRSIIRKRIERLRAAGETDNWMYKTFGHMDRDLPSSRGLSTQTMMKLMAPMSRALSGGYKSDLTSIRAARKEYQSDLADQAEEAGDEDTAAAIRNMSSAQFGKAMRIVGMIQRVTGKGLTSDELVEAAVEMVATSKGKKMSLFSMASEVINKLGLDSDDDTDVISKMGAMFTAKGTIRASWKREHPPKKRKG